MHQPVIFGLQRDFLEKACHLRQFHIAGCTFCRPKPRTLRRPHYPGAANTVERLPSLLLITELPSQSSTYTMVSPLRQTWSSAEQEVLRASLLSKGNISRPDTPFFVCRAWSVLCGCSAKRFRRETDSYSSCRGKSSGGAPCMACTIICFIRHPAKGYYHRQPAEKNQAASWPAAAYLSLAPGSARHRH